MTNSITIQFISWFLFYHPVKILEEGRLFIIWCWRFFSIGFFATRLFTPWHKDITSYGRGFDLKVWFKAATWNLISRFIGAVLRIVFIAVGLVLEVVIIIVTMVMFMAWLALPAAVVYLVASSFI